MAFLFAEKNFLWTGKNHILGVLFASLQSVMRQGDFNPTLVQLE